MDKTFDSTYKELKPLKKTSMSVTRFPFDSTYKELKLIMDKTTCFPGFTFDSTYKELKLVFPDVEVFVVSGFWLYL